MIVLRDGREDVVYLEPTVFYADESYDDDYTYFGVVLDDRYPDRLIVLRVYPDSPAFIAGLREGDEITTFHGQRLKTCAISAGFFMESNRATWISSSHTIVKWFAQAKFNERVAAREKTSAGANDRRPADNGNPQSDRQPGPARPRIRNRLHRLRRSSRRIDSRALPRAVSRRHRETSPAAGSRRPPTSRPVLPRPQALVDSNRRRRAIPRRDRRRPIAEQWAIDRLNRVVCRIDTGLEATFLWLPVPLLCPYVKISEVQSPPG